MIISDHPGLSDPGQIWYCLKNSFQLTIFLFRYFNKLLPYEKIRVSLTESYVEQPSIVDGPESGLQIRPERPARWVDQDRSRFMYRWSFDKDSIPSSKSHSWNSKLYKYSHKGLKTTQKLLLVSIMDFTDCLKLESNAERPWRPGPKWMFEQKRTAQKIKNRLIFHFDRPLFWIENRPLLTVRFHMSHVTWQIQAFITAYFTSLFNFYSR